MATKFAPLTLELIDEGEFLKQANQELVRIQGELRRYRAQHGDRAVKAKAKLVMEVNLQCELSDDTYSVKSLSKTTLPSLPPTVTMAMGGETQDEKDCLFVRKSGSTPDTPKQGVLTTKDGRTVNPETGEVIE